MTPLDELVGPPISARELRSILAPYPAAAKLRVKMMEFYRTIRFNRKVVGDKGGVYSMSIDYKTFAYSGVTVCFPTDVGNPAAQLTHELLHLSLVASGFPYLYAYGKCDRMMFDTALFWTWRLTNAIHHTLFYDDYLAMGFDPSEFAIEGAQAPNLDGVVETIHGRRARGEPVDHLQAFYYSAYAESWFQLYQHETSAKHAHHANVERVARESFPTADDDLRRIRDWFVAGAHRTADTHAAAYAELLRLVRLPPGWFYRLSHDLADGKVVVSPVVQDARTR